MKLSQEQSQFALEMGRSGVRPELIAAAMSRKYKATFTPLQIAELLKFQKNRLEIQNQRDEVAKQLSSHDGEMRHLRDALRTLFDDEKSTIREKIELAKEIRQNIGALQKMAAMKDEKGEFNVVLMVNDSSIQDEPVEAEVLNVEES